MGYRFPFFQNSRFKTFLSWPRKIQVNHQTVKIKRVLPNTELMNNRHYRGADASLVVFDLDQPRSFYSLANWINEARDNSPPECVLGLIGNKVFIDFSIVKMKLIYLGRYFK